MLKQFLLVAIYSQVIDWLLFIDLLIQICNVFLQRTCNQKCAETSLDSRELAFIFIFVALYTLFLWFFLFVCLFFCCKEGSLTSIVVFPGIHKGKQKFIQLCQFIVRKVGKKLSPWLQICCLYISIKIVYLMIYLFSADIPIFYQRSGLDLTNHVPYQALLLLYIIII